MAWDPFDFATSRSSGHTFPTVFRRLSDHLAQLGVAGTKVQETQTASFTVDAPGIWPVDATAGVVTVTLPDATASASWRIVVVKIDAGGNAVNVARAGSDTIDGGTGPEAITSQREKRSFVPIGTDWYTDLA